MLKQRINIAITGAIVSVFWVYRNSTIGLDQKAVVTLKLMVIVKSNLKLSERNNEAQ